jgi:hypothetical protein
MLGAIPQNVVAYVIRICAPLIYMTTKITDLLRMELFRSTKLRLQSVA